MLWLGTLGLLPLVLALFLARQALSRRRDNRLGVLQSFRRSRRAALEDLTTLAGREVQTAVDEARLEVQQACDEDAVTAALSALRHARPELDPPCALDPGHGPAGHPLSGAPGGGEARAVTVCAECAEVGGAAPRPKLVRHGDRLVPWFAGGPAYDAYAHGWFGTDLDELRAEAAALVEWDHGIELDAPEGHPTMGAGWYGVLLAANHRMGRFSSG